MERQEWDSKEWKRRLARLLREHPSVDEQTTGHIEINLNKGSATKVYRVVSESRDGGSEIIITKTELK